MFAACACVVGGGAGEPWPQAKQRREKGQGGREGEGGDVDKTLEGESGGQTERGNRVGRRKAQKRSLRKLLEETRALAAARN